MITLDTLRKIYTHTPAATLAQYVDAINSTFSQYEINTKSRQAMFLAQIGHESGGLTVVRENLNYSAERLHAVWPNRFPSVAAAAPYSHNPERLANKVYANRMGNGDESSGDGWRYRGRGAIQITGADMYRQIGMTPEQVETPQGAIQSAGAYWKLKNLNHHSDLGDVTTVTKLINGGTNGLAERKALYSLALRVL